MCSLENRDRLGTIIINELRHTQRCDHIRNLQPLRNAIEKEVTPEILASLLDLNCDKVTPLVVNLSAERAILHHNYFIKTELYQALGLRGKVYYNSWFHVEKFSVFWGITTSGLLFYTKTLRARKTSQDWTRFQRKDNYFI
jgi:hypothetical protein